MTPEEKKKALLEEYKELKPKVERWPRSHWDLDTRRADHRMGEIHQILNDEALLKDIVEKENREELFSKVFDRIPEERMREIFNEEAENAVRRFFRKEFEAREASIDLLMGLK